ncbi:DUF4136 domain-containing protein [Marinagarivorans algicola]|uniref:DUF4136 domain-containing protein n=1 Tax=Marinagarivorans algicola TaxID=1513270 RepID=UPI0006B60192|nr:DUF4136 domain-containing protein [Marinagarivorans algicola]
MLISIKQITNKTVKAVAAKVAVVSVLLVGACILVGCATGPRIHAVYEQGINFNDYKTYAFVDELAPKGEQGYRTLTNKYLHNAIRKELNSRGLTEAQNADLLINFNVSTKEKVTSTTSPTPLSGYYNFRGGYSYGMGYGTETRVSQYTEGTLNIDVVDAAQKQLIWEGVAIGKLKEPKENQLRNDIFSVVQQIFIQYPVAGPTLAKPAL